MTISLTGYGKSYGSFGEIVQGRLSNGEDFLVTLPVDLWSTCELVYEPVDGPSTVASSLSKSKLVAEQMLKVLDMQSGSKIQIEFTRNIPIGKGLSSSTADMLAVVRAFQEVFGVIVTENFISRIFASIEPHDGLHYYMCVAYNHRQGSLISKLNYIPAYRIVAVDSGGELSTVTYNKNLYFKEEDLNEYDSIFSALLAAFAIRDDAAIAECATRSFRHHIKRTSNSFMSQLSDIADDLDILGVVATHSGTCAGLLLPSDASDEDVNTVAEKVKPMGNVFHTKTLNMLL